MNKVRRKQLQEVYNRIRTAREDLSDILSEEQQAFDNMPENLQETERGQESDEIIDCLDDAVGAMDDAIEMIFEIL